MKVISALARQLRGTLEAANAKPGARFVLTAPAPVEQAFDSEDVEGAR